MLIRDNRLSRISEVTAAETVLEFSAGTNILTGHSLGCQLGIPGWLEPRASSPVQRVQPSVGTRNLDSVVGGEFGYRHAAISATGVANLSSRTVNCDFWMRVPFCRFANSVRSETRRNNCSKV